MILIDREIRALMRQGDLKLDPFDDALIQPSSIDLRLHVAARVLRASEAPLDTRNKDMGHEYGRHRSICRRRVYRRAAWLLTRTNTRADANSRDMSGAHCRAK